MKIISHRGNINGPNPDIENRPEQIDKVLSMGYDVEIDIRYIDGFFLGHEYPIYSISESWLNERSNNIWIHCKDEKSLLKIKNLGNFNFFWHDKDSYTITSKGFIWIYPNEKLISGGICVLPENGFKGKIKDCYAICTDYIDRWN